MGSSPPLCSPGGRPVRIKKSSFIPASLGRCSSQCLGQAVLEALISICHCPPPPPCPQSGHSEDEGGRNFLKIQLRTSRGPVVKTPCFQCRRCGFDPWLGTKILHVSKCSQKKEKKKKFKTPTLYSQSSITVNGLFAGAQGWWWFPLLN